MACENAQENAKSHVQYQAASNILRSILFSVKAAVLYSSAEVLPRPVVLELVCMTQKGN